MIAKQKQIEYQANTLKQLHETGLQYEASFKKTPPADPFCILMIRPNRGNKACPKPINGVDPAYR